MLVIDPQLALVYSTYLRAISLDIASHRTVPHHITPYYGELYSYLR